MKAKALVKNVRGTKQGNGEEGRGRKGGHPSRSFALRKSVSHKSSTTKSASRKSSPGTSSSKRLSANGQVAGDLERERKLHAETRRKLKHARAELHRQTGECDELRQRFEAAFRGAQIHAFSQDRDLRYLWVSGPHGDEAATRMVGKTDEELWSSPELQAAMTVKRRVLETGRSEDCEVSFITPERRALLALHIDPVFAADQSVKGILCTAVDISRIRSMESEQRQLNEELATAVQRYEFGLRGSNVTVFTQDTDLRYTAVSKPLFGRDAAELQGKTDEELLSGAHAAVIVALKREVLKKGVPLNTESRVDAGGKSLWYDFHIEPMRDVSGTLIGLTGAAIDITERKEAEAHLRLLMRELTHRSKNLLAVIQAMARQTARHSGSIAAFLDRFSARVQALARSHDLLVAEGWHGASLNELVRSQLAHYIDGESDQVSIDGPDIQLTPEATQSLGLALHELVTNAAKHGALSRLTGRVEVTWQPIPRDGGVELVWRETKGPKVSEPKRRGFGSVVIEHNLARALDAEVSMDFAPDGLTCRVAVPQTQIAGRP
jgi:PAS domain S-box-containing protein